MNIKSLSNNINSIDSVRKSLEKKDVKSESSHQDRDADGRRQQEEAPEKEFLTAEEVEEVLKAIKKFPGVINHNLTVAIERVGDRIFFKLIDPSSKVIRRMTSNEAWSFVKNSQEKTGHLLDKAL
ncbi:MAG: flagellar protein FlaG [Bdellovibrionales bacterium]